MEGLDGMMIGVGGGCGEERGGMKGCMQRCMQRYMQWYAKVCKGVQGVWHLQMGPNQPLLQPFLPPQVDHHCSRYTQLVRSYDKRRLTHGSCCAW